jgi:hypothetical protein
MVVFTSEKQDEAFSAVFDTLSPNDLWDYITDQICAKCDLCRGNTEVACSGDMDFLERYQYEDFRFPFAKMEFRDPTDLTIDVFSCYSLEKVTLIEFHESTSSYCHSVRKELEKCRHEVPDIYCYETATEFSDSTTTAPPSSQTHASENPYSDLKHHGWIPPTVLCGLLFAGNMILGTILVIMRRRVARRNREQEGTVYDLTARVLMSSYQELRERDEVETANEAFELSEQVGTSRSTEV